MKNNKKLLKFLLCASTFCTTIFCSIGTMSAYAISETQLENWPKWMQAIPDNTPLGRISIPGTHDSGTFKLQDPIKQVWAMTQEEDFSYQMDHGIRFFDIRGRLTDDNTIVLHHGPIYLYVTLHQFINEASKFLRDNPSETIIMSLKKEYDDMSGAKGSFVETFEEDYFQNPIFLKTDGNITLGDARGKIVLLRRYSGSTVTGGYNNFSWPDNTEFESNIDENLNVSVQDKYKASYYPKLDAVKSMLGKADDNAQNLNHIYINFTSLSSGGTAWNSPYYYASYMNAEVANYIQQKNPKRVGWVIQDYVGDRWSPKLHEAVIRTNKFL
ncbi:1-phosphatidylinositol phosphodiesterase [Bacillus clarus]|uniref:1-phosphatidylinositol phosphodiesterase n=1 Tax=Bacillus clarus TaxID=2338372 RepID=A0A090Y8D1_9BACI|nr:phosphatidylinositol-specific phospholipase C domain-containing protein [Bacillus clarus]KFM95033.1 1-phosphatidylinositol phosphodiesterase [Bacillus clarus]RFT62331.1 1-phosphatidylinositol phosphodiesterase [Bacillus clarus]